MFAVNIEIRDGDGGMVGDLALNGEAGLLHARGLEVRVKGGDIVGDALGESRRKITRLRIERAGHQRIGIGGKEPVVVIVGVVEKDLRIADAVFGGDGGVINLRDADIEDPIAGADDEWVSLAEGVRESSTRAEIVRLEGNFAGGREERVRE